MSQPRRWTLWASVGFLAVVLVAALITILVTGQRRDADARLDPRPSSAAPPSSEQCPSDTEQDLPTAAPPEGVRWEPLAPDVPFLLPVSDRYGPCVVTDTTATGYAHTPRGALLAAAQILIRASLSSDVGIDTIRAQVVPGQWRDAMLRDLQAEIDAGSDESIPDAHLAAYAIPAWSTDTARVSIALSYAAAPGQYRVFETDMAWIDGDWRMHPPIGGDWGNAARVTAQLPYGFVSWGPR